MDGSDGLIGGGSGGGTVSFLSMSHERRKEEEENRQKCGKRNPHTNAQRGGGQGAGVCVCIYSLLSFFWPSALKGFPYIEMHLLPFIPKRAFFRRSSAIIPIHLECVMQQQHQQKMARGQNNESERERERAVCVTLFILVCGFYFIFFISFSYGAVSAELGLSFDCSASPPPSPSLWFLVRTVTTVCEILLPNSFSDTARYYTRTVYPQ